MSKFSEYNLMRLADKDDEDAFDLIDFDWDELDEETTDDIQRFIDDYKAFYDWSMANGYKEEQTPGGVNILSIDRIDNDGNYEPSNCQWVTADVQAQNKRKRGN